MTNIIVAIISGLCVGVPTLVGNILSNNKAQQLTMYRIEQLEKKVDKHNNLVERMVKVEQRLDDLEKNKGGKNV